MADLTFKGSNLRRTDGSVWFHLVHGWLDEIAEVEGEDRTVALRHGLDGNPRWKRRRKVEMRGLVKAATWNAMMTLQNEVRGIFDPTVRGSLVVADQYKGLAAAQTATLTNCLPLSLTGAEAQTEFNRIYTVTFESIAIPPEWVIV